MPKNKLASFRYRIINSCLRNTGRKWSLHDLIDELSEQLYQNFGLDKGISRRTVFYDIELMRSLPPRGFDAPIVIKDGYYFYEDPEFSIDNISLSEKDLNSISGAISFLEQFNQLPISTELALIREKLFGEITSKDSDSKIIIGYETSEVKGSEFLIPLFKSIQDKNVLEILYKPFKHKNISTLIVHPYFLKQYNLRWYLIANCENYKDLGFYGLDRLLSFKILPDFKYKEDIKFEAENLFKDIIGISTTDNVTKQHIVLQFSAEQTPYIITKPIHSSQKFITKTNEGIEISLNLIPNYEFFSLILSFGSSVKIVSPEGLRIHILDILNNSINNYAVQNDCIKPLYICNDKTQY